LIITFIKFASVQRRHDSDDTISSAATTRYNLLEATTESDSDSDLHETLAARTQCSASRVSGAAKPDADASESNAGDSDSLSTGTDTDAGSDDFEHESLPDSEPDNDGEAPVNQWLSLIHKFTTDHDDSPAEPDSESEQRPPSRTDSVKTLCYDAEDYESIDSSCLPEGRSFGNAGNPFDANDQFDFNPAMTSARLNRFIRQHYLFDSVSGGQAVLEGYEPLKPAASIRPSDEPAPGCQHFI
jgi:hypothetical protein